jgi:hypothetical protein
MRGVRCCRRVALAGAIALGAVVGAPTATPASPLGGPPDSPTTQVSVTVTATCSGGPSGDYSFVATVPRSVRAGRPFPVEVALDGFSLPPTTAGYVHLSIGGGTATNITIAVEGSTYLVATWAPHQQFNLTITGFGFLDGTQFIAQSCVVDAPATLASIPVRHATPFDAAQITAEQRVGILCLQFGVPGFPGPRPFVNVQDVSVTAPNQARVGEPFMIEAQGAVSVTGGVESGQTITPTGAVGDTVDFSYNGSFTEHLPPPFPPLPRLICDQWGGTVHLASVPIVAH